MSESNQVRIAIRPKGSTDPWTVLRRTGDALTLSANTQRSNNVRSDRLRDAQKVTGLTVGGTVDFEMTASEYDDLIAAAMCSTWEADTPSAGTDQIKVGTKTTQFDVLKSYQDSDEHVLMQDMEVASLSINMSAGERITAQVTFAGGGADYQYDPSGDTFDSVASAMFFDSSNNLSSITVDGSPLTGTCITAMSINIDNSHQQDQCIGSLYQTQHKGSANITTNKTIRMSSEAFSLWSNMITNTPVAFSFTMGDGADSYSFSAPAEYLSGDLPSGGLDAILSLDLSGALAADAAGDMLTIERTIS